MADARELTYGISFSGDGALTVLDDMEQGITGIDQSIATMESDIGSATGVLSDMGTTGVNAAASVSNAAVDMGASFNSAGDGISKTIDDMAARSKSFGSAFRSSMSEALKAGDSLASSFKTGLSGAIAYTEKKFAIFRKNFVTGGKEITQAFKHPIQTIKSKLVEALEDAQMSVDDLATSADKTGKSLDDMGSKGSSAGSDISGAIGSALKAFVGISLIKKATSAIGDFISSAITAYKDAEKTNAQFEALFAGTGAGEWADDYASAVNRSKSQVRQFMVSNMAMYTGLGLTQEAATELSEITTSLAYDFGTAFNMDDSEALSLLQDAIGGNTEALNAYGIQLGDTELKDAAYRLGLGTDIEKLTEAEQAQVRLEAILAQTSDTFGVASEKTEGLTNKTKDLNGLWDQFTEDSGEKFAPAYEALIGTAISAMQTLAPEMGTAVSTLASSLEQVAPLLENMVTEAGPGLLTAFSNIIAGITPLLEPIMGIVTDVLSPLVEIIGEIVAEVGPPLAGVFNSIVKAIKPLITPLKRIVEAFLPPLKSLLEFLSPVIEKIGQVLEPIGNFIANIAEALGSVAGWLIDGASKVWDFFSGLFGGGKQAEETMEDLGVAVESVATAADDAALDIDTTAYASSIEDATDQAVKDTKASTNAQKEITNQNLSLMGIEATSVYGQMTLDAEDAWERMTTAAEEGAESIVAAFESIASAAKSVSNANISVTGVDLPGHAKGTDNFAGGWTRINEEGGEVAFLPGGTAILPADKSDRLLDGAGGQSFVFSPVVTIQVSGDVSDDTANTLSQRMKETLKELLREMQNDELDRLAIQNAYM